MYYYALERFNARDIARMHKICTTCGLAHLGDITNVFKCCIKEKEFYGTIYCRNCWAPNNPLNSTCDSCYSDIYKCSFCKTIYGDKDEYTQCCLQEKLVAGMFVKCPYCDKLVDTGHETCNACYNDLCICDICKKPYKPYEEETKCCVEIKVSSGEFIECKSCYVLNKKGKVIH
jgi:hypothetical protein